MVTRTWKHEVEVLICSGSEISPAFTTCTTIRLLRRMRQDQVRCQYCCAPKTAPARLAMAIEDVGGSVRSPITNLLRLCILFPCETTLPHFQPELPPTEGAWSSGEPGAQKEGR
jgi:hypothetical protein